MRKNRVHDELDTVKLTSPSAEDTYIGVEQKVAFMKELHGVPEPYREVLYLRLFGELSYGLSLFFVLRFGTIPKTAI